MTQQRQMPYWEGKSLVIYDAALRAAPKKNLKRPLGILLLIASSSLLLILISPLLMAEIRSRFYLSQPRALEESPDSQSFDQLLWLNNQGITAPADWGFSLMIPKIGVNAKVVPEVDLNSPQEINQALASGIAHAKGTALPNEGGTIYLFGHSTDYPWHIEQYHAWLYALKDLEIEDQVILAFQNKLSLWQVKEKKIVASSDVSFLSGKNDTRQLVIQTCWPPGTTLERLIVVASQLPLDKSSIIGLN